MPRRTDKVASFKSYGAKGGLSKMMGRQKSCSAVRAEEEAQTGKAKAFEETSKAFFAKRPRVLQLGIDGICAKDVLCCQACKTAAVSGTRKELTSDLIASKGALSKVAAKKAELAEHGVSTANLDAKGATAAMKKLIDNGAFRLHVDVGAPLGPVALHSAAPSSVAQPHPGAEPTPSRRKSRGLLSPPKSPRVQATRSERALHIEEAALAGGVNVSLREHIADDPILSEQFTDALKCCILRRCIRYSEYRMTGQYPHLEHREWNKVVALCLRYSHDLLHRKYLPLSRVDAQRVHDDLRAHREGMDWRSHWPHGHHRRHENPHSLWARSHQRP